MGVCGDKPWVGSGEDMKSENLYIEQGNGTTVLLCNGIPVLMDTEYVNMVSQYQWSIGSHGYATSGAGKKQMLLHRLICSAPENKTVDHINRNRLDNRKCNLRLCTTAQNSYNKAVSANTKSGFKGVCYLHGKWQAQIMYNSKSIYLGRYDDIFQAANAYDSAAFILMGDFAWRNFPEMPVQYDILEKVKGFRHFSRATQEERLQIAEMKKEGQSIHTIAVKMNKSESSIRRVLSGRTFKRKEGR